MGKQSAHEVEGALLIFPLDREENVTVRREISDRMTEDRVGDGGGQRKRRPHERPERLIEAIVRRRDDGFVETVFADHADERLARDKFFRGEDRLPVSNAGDGHHLVTRIKKFISSNKL